MRRDVEIVSDVAEFSRRAVEWNRLAARFKNPLVEHDWFLSCAEAFAGPGDLQVVMVRRDGILSAAAPMVATRSGLARRLEILGASVLHEPTGLLYDGEESLRELFIALTALSQPLWLQRIPAEPQVAAALAEVAAGRGWLAQSSGGASQFLAAPSTWEQYLKGCSSQRRYDLRRARRRLEERGSIECVVTVPGPSEMEPLLEAAFAIEASSWKGMAGSAIVNRPAMHDFFSRYSHRACAAGKLRLCFLKVDGQPVAMEIAVESESRFWVLKIGYDEQWASCSPGLQLMTECIRIALERGVAGHEFLGSAEAWVRPWSSGVRSYQTLRYRPRNWRGALSWSLDQVDRLRGKTKAVAGQMRRRWQSVVNL